MSGVVAVVSQIGSDPVRSPHISVEVSLSCMSVINPNAPPWFGAGVTLVSKVKSPPYPLGVPGGIGGEESPSYWAVITRRPPASSFNPLPFKSPWINALDADWKRPATGEVRSLSIRFSNSFATSPAVSAGLPTSKEYLTPLSVTL